MYIHNTHINPSSPPPPPPPPKNKNIPTFINFHRRGVHRLLPSSDQAGTHLLQELCDDRYVVPVHHAVQRPGLQHPPLQVVGRDVVQGVVELLQAEVVAAAQSTAQVHPHAGNDAVFVRTCVKGTFHLTPM